MGGGWWVSSAGAVVVVVVVVVVGWQVEANAPGVRDDHRGGPWSEELLHAGKGESAWARTWEDLVDGRIS